MEWSMVHISYNLILKWVPRGGNWVGKMCCKAPGGKYAKSISTSRKSKSEKVSLWISKSRKVYFLTFHFLTVWTSAGCLSSWTCAAKSTKLKPLRVEREEEKPKTRKVEKVRGKKKSQKVKSRKVYILSDFSLFDFLPDAFPAEHAQLFFAA